MRKANLTDYGIAIKRRLLDLGQSQEWLVNEVRAKYGTSLDSSYLNRIMTGKVKNPQVKPIINNILNIDQSTTEQGDTTGGTQNAQNLDYRRKKPL